MRRKDGLKEWLGREVHSGPEESETDVPVERQLGAGVRAQAE